MGEWEKKGKRVFFGERREREGDRMDAHQPKTDK